jgi:hypothetical protein
MGIPELVLHGSFTKDQKVLEGEFEDVGVRRRRREKWVVLFTDSFHK